MQFDWWTLALQTVNFAVLVWLLHRFLYKPVLAMIDARRARIDKGFADAADAEREAKARLAALEAQHAAIRAEREQALLDASLKAEEAAKERRLRAEEEAATLVAETRKALAAERETALVESRGATLELAIGIARRLLAEMPVELRAEAWLERIERHLAGLPEAERDAILHGPPAVDEIRVVTASPLPEALLPAWRDRLGRLIGAGVAIRFEVDPALVAGVELHLSTAVLRFSWRSALDAIRTEMSGDAHAR